MQIIYCMHFLYYGYLICQNISNCVCMKKNVEDIYQKNFVVSQLMCYNYRAIWPQYAPLFLALLLLEAK